MKAIIVQDMMTGEQLEIEFDLKLDIMHINGLKVVRKKALESDENEFVFGLQGRGTTKLYHLSKDQVDYIKSL